MDQDWADNAWRTTLALFPLPFLLPLKSLQRILSCSRSNSDTFCNTWALLKLWHYFTRTLRIERWLTLPSLVTLLLPPLRNTASQDTQFISLLPTLAISFIGSPLGKRRSQRGLLKRNPMLLPLHASLPETSGFSSRNPLPLRFLRLCDAIRPPQFQC